MRSRVPARLALLVFALGCTASQVKPRPGAARTVAAPSPSHPPVQALLTENCSACHDGRDRVALGAGAALPPELALRAAMMVGARRMPPGRDGLPDPVRARLLEELCAFGSKDPRTCVAMNEARVDAAPHRSPREFLRAIEGVGSRPAAADPERALAPAPWPDPALADQLSWQGDRTPAEDLLDIHVSPAAELVWDDPTLEAIKILLVRERCSSIDAERDPQRFAACARGILSRKAGLVPRPAPTQGN